MATNITALRTYHRGLAHFASLPVNNLSAQSWVATVPMEQFAQMADIANEARVGATGGPISQRPLDASHSFRLAKYLMRAMVSAALHAAERDSSTEPDVLASLQLMHRTLGAQPVFALQPFVVSVRQQDRGELSTQRTENFEVLTIANKSKLWVIDGQHRVHAIRAFRDFLYEVHVRNHYPSIKIGDTDGFCLYSDSSTPRTEVEGQAWRRVEYQFNQCDVALNIFTDLDISQEKQLFHDLNNLGKPVDGGLAFEFDESNPVNLWIKRTLIPHILGGPQKVASRDQKNWDVDEGRYVRKDLAAVNAFLFLRKTSVKTAEPRHVTPEAVTVASDFWKAITSVKGMGGPGAKKAVVLAQPVVQKALARLVNEFGIHKSKRASAASNAARQATLKTVLAGIGSIDWHHTNPLWRAWLMDDPESKFRGLTPYLPKDRAKAKGEFATIDNNRVRFGVKHNEIASALENLIRYQLKLPPKRGR